MSIFERVHELIKEQGLNVKQLERECGLANATIRRWETQTPNIESVRKVAHRLNVTIDYLVNGGSPNAPAAPSCDGVPLSSMEADLVAMFRLLPEEAKKEIFDLTHFKYTRLGDGEKSLSSGHISTGATTKKAAPPRAVKLATEPPDFLPRYD